MRKKIITSTAILCRCLAAYTLIPSTKPVKNIVVPQEMEKFVVIEQAEPEYQDASEELYILAYKKGFHSFMAQYNLEESGKVYKYTTQIEEHKETEKYHEVIDKGYVDGYHKAAESGFCPRF
jgi:hypothetical protein